jgi:hypothetical protein
VRYDTPTRFNITAVVTSGEAAGRTLRVILHATPVGTEMLFRAGPALWENDFRYHLEYTVGVEQVVLDEATKSLATQKIAHFDVTCLPANSENMGFLGVRR